MVKFKQRMIEREKIKLPPTSEDLVPAHMYMAVSWRYQREVRKTGAVFLLFGSKTETTNHGTVYVRFKDGKVLRVWRNEN